MFSNKRRKASDLVYEDILTLNPGRLHGSAYPHQREPYKPVQLIRRFHILLPTPNLFAFSAAAAYL